LKSEEDLEKALGCAVDNDDKNEKHEKNNGVIRTVQNNFFSDEDENDQIKLRIGSISSNRSNTAENL
jgi:hypothetical protein